MPSAPTSTQIPFDLAPRKAPSFDNFLTSECNAAVAAHLKAWALWPSPILLLIGESGTGKTHLGRAFEASAEGLVFLDDAHNIEEAKLFAQMNRALNGEVKALLLASGSALSDWGTQLPDLRSRLKNTSVMQLPEPDDALLELIVRDLFEAQGRTVSRDVVSYIAARTVRTVSALQEVVAKLEAAAQTHKADMTKAFASRQMSKWDAPELF